MRSAFSLVELSIVLVILGLLTGGILAGQSLIRASELRSATTEFQRNYTALQTFRSKYNALPGDMMNAQAFWGVAHATPATCVTTASTTSATCNGDGDGMIETVSAGANEAYRSWQHLANAGLIEGSYSGVTGPLDVIDALPTNSPASRLGQGLWTLRSLARVINTDADYYEGEYGTVMYLGNDTTTSQGEADGGIMNASEMWGIDVKLDDGRPGYGRLISRENRSACVTTTVFSTAEYNLTTATYTSGTGCVVLFRNL